MPKYCLIKPLAEEFKRRLKSGDINPEKLNQMTSEERHNFFAEFLGEDNAKNVNSLFESKLLLKNQQQGLINWAKITTGIKPEVRQDLITRIGKMDKVLNPAEEKAFLQDLASTKLGTDVTFEEAQKITELSNKVKELENLKNTEDIEGSIQRGLAKLNLSDYVNSLNPKKANFLTNLANLPRSVMASFDLSAPLNQGWGMLSRKQFYSAIGSMFKYVRSAENLRRLQADIITRPTYDMAKKSGLRLTELGQKLEKREEQFMSTLIDRIPGMAASQRAYVGFLNKLRMDVFDDLIRKATIAGEDVGLGTKTVEDIASVVNTFTGGSRVGSAEGATPILNAAFFSPRKIASTINILNPVNYISPNISKTARLAATRNLIGSLAITTAAITVGSLLVGTKPETDPTSSDLGKIRIGNNTLDVSGGNANYATLISRLLTGKVKSPTTGIKKSYGNKIGQTSLKEVMGQFASNKFSPNFSLIIELLTHENNLGKPRTAPQSIIDRFKPMFLNSVYELIKDDTAGNFAKSLFAILSTFGAGLGTFSSDVDWSTDTTKGITNLRENTTPEEFKQLNDEYNKQVKSEVKDLMASEDYQSMSDDEKQKEITKLKAKIKKSFVGR